MLFCLPVSAATTYSFGSGEMFKEADWGKDGFTFQFAQMYNQAGDYDVSQFQDCEWGNSSAYAMYVSGRRMWCPTVRAADTGKFKNDTMWWQVSNENGSIMPSNGLLAILRWTAPQDGKYTVNTTLLAGDSQAYEDHQKKAEFYRDQVIPAMNALRQAADQLESEVGAKYWPYPVYSDLLFRI